MLGIDDRSRQRRLGAAGAFDSGLGLRRRRRDPGGSEGVRALRRARHDRDHGRDRPEHRGGAGRVSVASARDRRAGGRGGGRHRCRCGEDRDARQRRDDRGGRRGARPDRGRAGGPRSGDGCRERNAAARRGRARRAAGAARAAGHGGHAERARGQGARRGRRGGGPGGAGAGDSRARAEVRRGDGGPPTRRRSISSSTASSSSRFQASVTPMAPPMARVAPTRRHSRRIWRWVSIRSRPRSGRRRLPRRPWPPGCGAWAPARDRSTCSGWRAARQFAADVASNAADTRQTGATWPSGIIGVHPAVRCSGASQEWQRRPGSSSFV